MRYEKNESFIDVAALGAQIFWILINNSVMSSNLHNATERSLFFGTCGKTSAAGTQDSQKRSGKLR